MSSAPVSKIPVTILTGFLGSGKTTLLNRILSEHRGKRIAVIENEFGAAPIDNDLVISAKEELFELADGCMCCSVRADLIRIVDGLTKRAGEFDHIILETTGLADPEPVAQTFFVEEGIKDRAALDAVVTVVDAKNVLRHIDESRACLDQIAFADIILLAKCDLSNPRELDAVETRLRAINSIAKIERVSHCEAPVGGILAQGGFDLDRALEIKPAFLKDEYPFAHAASFDLVAGKYTLLVEEQDDEGYLGVILVPDEKPMRDLELDVSAAFTSGVVMSVPLEGMFRAGTPAVVEIGTEGLKRFHLEVTAPGRYVLFTEGRPADFGIGLVCEGQRLEPLSTVDYVAGHVHDQDVTSISLSSGGTLDTERFRAWLDKLLHEHGDDIYRAKGILDDGSPNRFVVHAVHELVDALSDREWRSDETRRNQLVFIGRNLDETALQRGIHACLIDGTSAKLVGPGRAAREERQRQASRAN